MLTAQLLPTIRCSGLLMWLQHVLEFCKFIVADDPVKVHLLQDMIAGQLLATLILEQCPQHPGSLLACKQHHTMLYLSLKLTYAFKFHSSFLNPDKQILECSN